MIANVITIVMCAAACSAQLPMDCECETVIRREPICESVYRAQPIYRAEVMEPEVVQQRVDSSRSYPVLLSSTGPEVTVPPVVQMPPVTAPVRERPVIRLPHAPIPPERVISHKCLCTKTVVRPQIIQRVITVPRVQRYLRRGYRPVVENIAYTTQARGCDNYDEGVVAEVPVPVPVPVRAAPCIPFTQVSSIC